MCTNRGAGVCRAAASALAAWAFHSVTVSARAKPGKESAARAATAKQTRRYRCGFMISPSFSEDDGDLGPNRRTGSPLPDSLLLVGRLTHPDDGDGRLVTGWNSPSGGCRMVGTEASGRAQVASSNRTKKGYSVDFRILGPLEVHDRGRAVPLGGRQQRSPRCCCCARTRSFRSSGSSTSSGRKRRR